MNDDDDDDIMILACNLVDQLKSPVNTFQNTSTIASTSAAPTTLNYDFNSSYLRKESNNVLSSGGDLQAMDTWIYPTNFPIREYQYNIVKSALFQNTLVCLPTGLGKTFIGAVVMYNYYRWFPTSKIIFIAPTRPLVRQQIEACFNVMGIPQEHMVELTGLLASEKRTNVWKNHRILFLTPQVLANDISRGICPMRSIKLIVIDEGHKALGGHSYCQVIHQLKEQNYNFRVVSLSATPGSDIAAIQQVLRNLLISRVELRTEECLDVVQFTHQRNIEKIVVKIGQELDSIKDKFFNIVKPYVQRLIDHSVLYTKNATSLSKFQLLKSRECFRQNPPSNMHQKTRGILEGTYALCMTLYHALELLSMHSVRCFYNFLQGSLENKNHSSSRGELMKNGAFVELLNSLSKVYSSSGQENKEGYVVASHPKMEKLKHIVEEHFDKKNNDLHTSTRVMIFSQYRDSVLEITDVLKSCGPIVKPMSFIGQSCAARGRKGIPQKEQLKVVKQFKDGGFNTLISTCVGEEGLDIGEVDLIICYDMMKSPIRLVQRMGRTGRKREGRIVILLTEGKEEQIYKESQIKMKNLTNALQKGDKFSSHLYPNSPRMIPDEIQPVCLRMKMKLRVWKETGGAKLRTPKTDKKDIPSFFKKSSKAPMKKGKGFLNSEEQIWFKENLLVDEALVKTFSDNKFVSLSSKEKKATEETVVDPSVIMLGNYHPWQSTLQPCSKISHSMKSQSLVELTEFINLQLCLGNDNDSYTTALLPYLDMSYFQANLTNQQLTPTKRKSPHIVNKIKNKKNTAAKSKDIAAFMIKANKDSSGVQNKTQDKDFEIIDIDSCEPTMDSNRVSYPEQISTTVPDKLFSDFAPINKDSFLFIKQPPEYPRLKDLGFISPYDVARASEAVVARSNSRWNMKFTSLFSLYKTPASETEKGRIVDYSKKRSLVPLKEEADPVIVDCDNSIRNTFPVPTDVCRLTTPDNLLKYGANSPAICVNDVKSLYPNSSKVAAAAETVCVPCRTFTPDKKYFSLNEDISSPILTSRRMNSTPLPIISKRPFLPLANVTPIQKAPPCWRIDETRTKIESKVDLNTKKSPMVDFNLSTEDLFSEFYANETDNNEKKTDDNKCSVPNPLLTETQAIDLLNETTLLITPKTTSILNNESIVATPAPQPISMYKQRSAGESKNKVSRSLSKEFKSSPALGLQKSCKLSDDNRCTKLDDSHSSIFSNSKWTDCNTNKSIVKQDKQTKKCIKSQHLRSLDAKNETISFDFGMDDFAQWTQEEKYVNKPNLSISKPVDNPDILNLSTNIQPSQSNSISKLSKRDAKKNVIDNPNKSTNSGSTNIATKSQLPLLQKSLNINCITTPAKISNLNPSLANNSLNLSVLNTTTSPIIFKRKAVINSVSSDESDGGSPLPEKDDKSKSREINEFTDEDNDFKETSALVKPAKVKMLNRKTKKRKRNGFIELEAEVSYADGGEASPDESEEDLDTLDESFVDDLTQATQQNVDMDAFYLQSVRSPPKSHVVVGKAFTKKRRNPDSDEFENYSQDDDDSFVVENDFIEYDTEYVNDTLLAEDPIINAVLEHGGKKSAPKLKKRKRAISINSSSEEEIAVEPLQKRKPTSKSDIAPNFDMGFDVFSKTEEKMVGFGSQKNDFESLEPKIAPRKIVEVKPFMRNDINNATHSKLTCKNNSINTTNLTPSNKNTLSRFRRATSERNVIMHVNDTKDTILPNNHSLIESNVNRNIENRCKLIEQEVQISASSNVRTKSLQRRATASNIADFTNRVIDNSSLKNVSSRVLNGKINSAGSSTTTSFMTSSDIAGSSVRRTNQESLILVDSSEMGHATTIHSRLRNVHGFTTKVTQIKPAGYVVSNRVAICRISYSNYVNAAFRTTLVSRLQELLRLYERPVVIVESDRGLTLKDMRRNHYMDTIACACAQLPQMKVLQSANKDESCDLIKKMADSERLKGYSIPAIIPDETKVKFYRTFPKVNCACAIFLSKNFQTVAEFLNSSAEDLMKNGKLTRSQSAAVLSHIKRNFRRDMLPPSYCQRIE